MQDYITDPFEIYENEDGSARFCFSHSDSRLTTGVLVLQPNTLLPKHNRPLGWENLLQVSGTSQMTVYDMENTEQVEKTVDIKPGEQLRMQKGQWHIHGNPFDEVSVTFFKLVGDITEIMGALRKTSSKVQPKDN